MSNEKQPENKGKKDFLRFHYPYIKLSHTFGDQWFALKAEAFARFFGTPVFLIGQTLIVAVWICINMTHLTVFDPYPFILLNLAFSLQAAYAAPLILLAQTKQAERDHTLSVADAEHREDLARANEQRQMIAEQNAHQILELLHQNTELTQLTKELAERIEKLTLELHNKH